MSKNLARQLRNIGIRRNSELTDEEKEVLRDSLDLYLQIGELETVDLNQKDA